MKRNMSIWICLVCFIVAGARGWAQTGGLVRHLERTVKAGEIFSLVEELSSPAYEGRLTGAEGYDRAAAFAAAYFKKYGVSPAFSDYMQSFTVSYTKVFESALRIFLENGDGSEEIIDAAYFKDFFPLGFSGSGDVRAEIVFAGFGITAPEFGYDDYRDIDVNGKIVMVFKGAPRARDNEDWREYDSHMSRAVNARDHGAVGMLYVYKPVSSHFGRHLQDFPMVFIDEKLADKIFAKKNLTAKNLKKAVFERDGKTHSHASGILAHLMVKSENFQGSAHNVVGIIPGSDPGLKHEAVVIGAHLDHLGQWPVLMPGADDNASGSAAVLACARALASYPVKPKRSLVFILFAGEEMGLLGSEYFVNHLPPQLEKVKFVINMDMIGSGPDVFILRLKNYPVFEGLVNEARRAFQLQAVIKGNKVTGQRRRGADHAPFVENGAPAVSVFSSGGGHHGYHTDGDTIYRVTPRITGDIAKIAGFAAFAMAGAHGGGSL
jgi:hypothetical protein